MNWWHKLESFVYSRVSSKYYQLISVIGHTLLTMLCVLIGALLGSVFVGALVLGAFCGYLFGLGGYTFREGSEMLNKGLKNWKQNLEDWAGPFIGGGLLVIALWLWC